MSSIVQYATSPLHAELLQHCDINFHLNCKTKLHTKRNIIKKGFHQKTLILKFYHISWNIEWLLILITLACFIYILDSSNSSSFSFWSSQLASCSRSNWTGVWNGNSNGTWTDKQSSHFSTAKEIIFHVTITTNKFWNDAEMMLKSFWTSHLQMMNKLEPLL